MSDVGCNHCKGWIQRLPIPEKVIILPCKVCGTEYTLFPNGQISYDTPQKKYREAFCDYVIHLCRSKFNQAQHHKHH